MDTKNLARALANGLREDKTLFIRHRDGRAIIDKLVEIMGEELRKGNYVRMLNFGKFVPFVSPSRIMINPVTNKKMIRGKSIIPKFRPSDSLKIIVNGDNN